MKYVLTILFLSVLFISCEREPVMDPREKEYLDTANNDYDEGNFDAAIRNYTKALRVNPDRAMTWLKRGDAKRKNLDPYGAISDYTESLKRNPSGARALYHRGTIRIMLGMKDEGCEDVKAAAELCYFPADEYYEKHCKD